MIQRELFRDLPEHEGRSRIRPLGPFSDYVVQQLPDMLIKVKAGEMLPNSLNEGVDLVGGIDLAKIFGDPSLADLACFDLKMLDAAIVHLGGTSSPTLTHLVDTFSVLSSQPPSITYEEIVLVNPAIDRRTFTAGQVGRTEGDFYEIHRRIEGDLDRVVSGANNAAMLLAAGKSGITSAVEILGVVQEDLKPVLEKMDKVGREMDPAHFAEFRPYLTTHPLRGIKGPSGAFTAGIPTLELLLAGEVLSSDHQDYLIQNLMYYPRAGREDILRAQQFARAGESLKAQCEKLGMPQALVARLKGISNTLGEFRGKHFRGVKNQVPQALEGNAPGTGGELDVKEFLLNRARTIHI